MKNLGWERSQKYNSNAIFIQKLFTAFWMMTIPLLLIAPTAMAAWGEQSADSSETAAAMASPEGQKGQSSQTPFLSNLSAGADDPVFATYAAPIRRSEYIVDEGYRFKFYNREEPLHFDTDHAGSWGVLFRKEGETRFSLSEMAEQPEITTSYSDLVKYNYRPFKDIKVEVFFQVYSSHFAIQNIKVTNTSAESTELALFPYLSLPKSAAEIKRTGNRDAFAFEHEQQPDGWTKRKHDVPHQTRRSNYFLIDQTAEALGSYRSLSDFRRALQSGSPMGKQVKQNKGVIAFQKSLNLDPGESISVRVVRGVRDVNEPMKKLKTDARALIEYDMSQAVAFNESLYESIPRLDIEDKDKRMMYWNAFNLIRQCMLPPEGKTSYNHYVYSREPTWGWGHAGQVFHESLTMLAYVYMDPESAEDSQRLYMERQWENGYIEYRAGPYLDAMNYVNGEFTSSAPWFNYENWEIFKVSRDTSFLKEAYRSGTKFYKWWLRNRDKDEDGLAEWGGHAVLESVRDAQVAVWKEVGWPSNFEAPELNAMLVKEARALSHMAKVLGKSKESDKWRREARQRSERIQNTFWHEESDFFYYVDKKDNDFTHESKNDLLRQSIVGFIPLWAGTLTDDQADKLVQTMTDPDKFWRPYGIPSLAADDSFYDPRGYWNGPVWVEWQYLIMNGLLENGYNQKADRLADRVFDNVIYHLKDTHTFWEFYSPESKWAGHHQTYIWTGIVARMMIELQSAGK